MTTPTGRDCPICGQPNMSQIYDNIEKWYYIPDSKIHSCLIVSVYLCTICGHLEEKLFDTVEENKGGAVDE